jgi:predicted DNA-binding WGR domain protein
MNVKKLHYSDGKSDKFWTITIEGNSHTVHYGRVGTNGQTQTKEFSTDAEALKSYEKLVQQKLKKGYVEVNSDTNLIQETPAENKTELQDTQQKEFTATSSDSPDSDSNQSVQDLLNITRLIELNPEDWIWTTWRHKQPVQKPEAKPFDKDKALKRLAKIIHINNKQNIDWKKAKISPILTREEAHFWFIAMTDVAMLQPFSRQVIEKLKQHYATSNTGNIPYICDEDLIDNLTQQSFTGEIDQEFIVSTLIQANWKGSQSWEIKPEIFIPIANLVNLMELVIAIENLFHYDNAEFRNYIEQTWGSDYISSLAASRQSSSSSGNQESIEAEINSNLKNLRKSIPQLLSVLNEGFAEYVLPYGTAAEIEAMREHLGSILDDQKSIYPLYRFAAHLEINEEVRLWVQSLQNLHDRRMGDLIFAIGEPHLMATEMRRLEYLPCQPTDIRTCLAYMGEIAFDIIRQAIFRAWQKEDTAKLIQAFSAVKAPEAAPYMLEFWLFSKAPYMAQNWFDENPIHAILGLIPIVGGEIPKSVEATASQMTNAAIAFLRKMKRKGYTQLIQAAIERESAEVAESVRKSVLEHEEITYPLLDEQTTPEWLQKGIAEINSQKVKPINWVSSTDLPPIVIEQHCLNDDQGTACLLALHQSTFESPHPLISTLKTKAERKSLDAFIWALFERWLKQGAPSKEKWGMEALGLLGGDAIALKLTPFIRTWPGENQHHRAVKGLECLRAIGTDTALMQINGIAQKVKFKAIKERARECMDAIAQDRGLTREELEDRIVPDCDLDEKGTRLFDFGSRQFRFVLGQDMKPMVRDEAGKLKTNLPKPGVKDDTELANRAIAEWKLLKKQINEVAKLQAFRLEQAMITERKWQVQEFETLLVRHPLMFNLSRLLVWGTYDQEGKLVTTFHITEDQTYADSEDESLELEEMTEVGIVHPIHLDSNLLSVWGELMSDYEIIPPFPQLGRTVYHLNSDEMSAQEITRFKDIKIEAIALSGTLEKLGWVRGALCDHGCFYEHLKPFYHKNITAIVGGYDGIATGMVGDWGEQTIPECFFVLGRHTAKTLGNPVHWLQQPLKKVSLSQVYPLLISEVLRDLYTVKTKGK